MIYCRWLPMITSWPHLTYSCPFLQVNGFLVMSIIALLASLTHLALYTTAAVFDRYWIYCQPGTIDAAPAFSFDCPSRVRYYLHGWDHKLNMNHSTWWREEEVEIYQYMIFLFMYYLMKAHYFEHLSCNAGGKQISAFYANNKLSINFITFNQSK